MGRQEEITTCYLVLPFDKRLATLPFCSIIFSAVVISTYEIFNKYFIYEVDPSPFIFFQFQTHPKQ